MRHGRLCSAVVVAAIAGGATGQSPPSEFPVAPAVDSAPDVTEIPPTRLTLPAAAEVAGPPAPAPDKALPSTTVPPPAVGSRADTQAATGPGWWIDADYLRWWTRHGPLPVPLVTTGNPTDVLPGALGQSGTRPRFGGSGLDYGGSSGGRLTVGGWLDCQHTVGLEAEGFLFKERSIRFAVGSDSAGNPPIYLPVVNQDPTSPNFGRQSSYTVADPLYPDPTGPTFGNVTVSSATRLWGAEVNGLANLGRSPCWAVDGIVGFRYLDLQESLRVSGFSNDLFDDLQQTFQDDFATRNQFYGGQLGARFCFRSEYVTLTATGKVAVGSTHEVVDIRGASVWGGTGFALPPGVYPGGVYAQPSNIGRTTTDTFAVVPQVGLKLALCIAPGVTANVGYDFLYWTSVVRPGNQIDHNLNPTQFPGAGVTGPLLPAPLFNRSDFLAHGLSFGLTFAY